PRPTPPSARSPTRRTPPPARGTSPHPPAPRPFDRTIVRSSAGARGVSSRWSLVRSSWDDLNGGRGGCANERTGVSAWTKRNLQLVPTVLRGNAVFDALRRTRSAEMRTQGVQDGIPKRSMGTSEGDE